MSRARRPITASATIWMIAAAGIGGAAASLGLHAFAAGRCTGRPVHARRNDAQTIRPASAAATTADRHEALVLTVRRETGDSLFVVPATSADGTVVGFGLDTGAEISILRSRDAAAMNARMQDVSDREVVVIGSTTPMRGAVIPVMTVAGVEMRDVPVLIGPDSLPCSLLGQAEIARLGRVEFEADEIRIVPAGSAPR